MGIKATMTAYCLCGASIALSGNIAAVDAAIKLWGQDHIGAGHGPTDKRTCRNSRTGNTIDRMRANKEQPLLIR